MYICSVGVIEWVSNTLPLKDFLTGSLTEGERKRYTEIPRHQSEWLKKYNGNYKTMYT